METRKVVMELPVGVFSVLRKTPRELSDELRLVAAVKWYEMGQVSQEKASEIAGLCREDFLTELFKFKVSPFQYNSEDALKEGWLDQ